MRKPLTWLRITAIGVPALLLILMGVVYGYVSQKELPRGLTVSGWQVGGMTFAAFEAELQRRTSALQQTPLRLQTAAYALPPLQTTLGKLGVAAGAAAVRQEVTRLRSGTVWERAKQRWRLRHAALELRVDLSEASANAALKAAWRPLYDERAVDAKRVITPDDQVTYVPEKSVPRVDTPKLKKLLLAAVPPVADWGAAGANRVIDLQVPLYQQVPDTTVESLKAQGVERKFSEFTTAYSGSSAGRMHNIESTSAMVQDMYLKPGDIFDYAKVIAATQKKYGYQDAPVILNGKIVPGVGGGICQVSTTLYNAVLRGGLEIVERRNHSLPISYAPIGQDATFSTGYINFRFRNNTGHGLLIRTEAADGRLTVKLFGKVPQDISYDIQSKVVQTVDPPVKYVHSGSLRPGEQKELVAGKRGYVVETTRYKLQSGKVIGGELVSRDTYKAQPTIVGVGSGGGSEGGLNDGSEAPAPHIEDGIQGPKFR